MTASEFTTARKCLWKTQDEAAIAMGVARVTVGSWERGQAPVPEYAVKLLECLEQKQVAEEAY